ncbi:MAG: tRNA pseudouridine(38-40) synthase TruA [Muribaculaceae bacterium]|nr:tRNA pseudouridine(38-40) synthase TruA [Muribaculaceae bacterium]
MHLAYRGAPFHGWQSQPNAVSVQSTIEQALSTIMRRQIKITGAGRTDTGVSARKMVAHFDVDQPLSDEQKTVVALNSLVGRDIAIYSITRVHDDAHARFDATSRTYRYFATTVKSPFFHTLAWQASPRLDFEAMNRAAAILPTVSDFTSFAKLHSDAKTNICKVTRASWSPIDDKGWMFEITADRFLRTMVRSIVGTLVEVGRGKMSESQFLDVINARNRCEAGTSMPPQALYLWDITYPYYSTL